MIVDDRPLPRPLAPRRRGIVARYGQDLENFTVGDVYVHWAIANLGWCNVRLSSPVFAGGTLYVRTKVFDARPSKLRLGASVAPHAHGYKRDIAVVLSSERVSLAPRRGYGPESKREPL